METLSCSARYGKGGLGMHFAQLIEDARQRNELAGYFTVGGRPGDEAVTRLVSPRLTAFCLSYTPIRFNRGWRDYAAGEMFDRAVDARLDAPVETFVGFVGKSLHSFGHARRLGAERLVLHTPNAHVRRTQRLYGRACAVHGVEPSWLNERQLQKALREYHKADVIVVNSEYVRESFLEHGFPPEKLERVHLRPSVRFQPPEERSRDGQFRVVYVGSISVAKGVPLLIEAFHRLPDRDARLTLVGGIATRGMRRYVEEWLRREPRVTLTLGDPLPHLHRADVYVHPSYMDGFGYAPAEALATGLPVIVTEDTGVKEYVLEGANGYVVPTGDPDALYERLWHVHETRKVPSRELIPDFTR